MSSACSEYSIPRKARHLWGCSNDSDAPQVTHLVEMDHKTAIDNLKNAVVLHINGLQERLSKQLNELHYAQEGSYQKLLEELGVQNQQLRQEMQEQAQQHALALKAFTEITQFGMPVRPKKEVGQSEVALSSADDGVQKDQTCGNGERKDDTRRKMFSKYGPEQLKVAEDNTEGWGQGAPTGEFKGRPNLFAFLEAKNWDSEAAVNPDKELAPVEGPTGLKKVVMSHNFDLMVGVIIVANAVVMALRLEYEATFIADSIGLKRDDGAWPEAKQAFHVLEHVFSITFLLEFLLRFRFMACSYFKNAFNCMDFAIVVISVSELYILPVFLTDSPDLLMLQLLRIFRLIRVLRILRMLRFFERLRTMVTAVAMSMPSLYWSVVLLAIVMLIGSILITMTLQSFLQEEGEDDEVRREVYKYFGSFSRSCITLFEITIAPGTWSGPGRTVIFGVDRNYTFFFLGYLMFVSFAMIRVITAIFLKDTLSAAAKDSDLIMAEQNRDQKYVKQIRMVFSEMDKGGNGSINLSELNTGLQDQKIREQLASIGVSHHEVKGLFTLMDDGDDEITFAEFLTGTMRLKNANKGVDLVSLLYENKKLLSRVLGIGSQVDKLREHLGAT